MPKPEQRRGGFLSRCPAAPMSVHSRGDSAPNQAGMSCSVTQVELSLLVRAMVDAILNRRLEARRLNGFDTGTVDIGVSGTPCNTHVAGASVPIDIELDDDGRTLQGRQIQI